MIKANNLTYRIGPKTLVEDVSLALPPGELVAVVGPNGAGKTTLLRLLSGELAPSKGRVTLDDQGFGAWESTTLAKRRAVLPQHSALAFGFTVQEVVLLGRTPHRTAHAHNATVLRWAMEEAGVTHLAARRYPTLSGGEQQRVHLARVLAQLGLPEERRADHTYTLFLDEPTASLDLAFQHQTLQTAQRCAENGVAVLAALHDLNLAAQYADKIAVMHDGRLQVLGTPHEVLTPDVIQHVFGMPVHVTANPCAACPLIIPMPPVSVSLPVLTPTA